MKLNFFAGLGLLAAMGTIFLYAPEERTQGIVQKIFYIHVASAITMYVGFFIAFLSGLLYLLERKLSWDEITVSAVEPAFFLCTMVLATGPVWAKPIWGTWWTWEPRLTTTFLLWLLYAGYVVLRGYFGASARGRVVTSIVAVVALLDVPLIHFSVRLWRGMHPTVLAGREGGIPASMQLTLGVTLAATLALYAALFRARLRLEKARNKLTEIRLEETEST